MSAKHAMDLFSCNFVHKRIGRAFRGLVGAGPLGAVGGFLSPDLPSIITPQRSITGRGCAEGFQMNAAGGCDRVGVVGAIQRFLPGGSTGTAVATSGAGPGMLPIRAPFREQRLTLSCGPGWVLGMDELCYPKQMLPNKWRKWPKGTKPFLTGGEVRVLRRAKSLEKRFKRLTTGKNKLFQ